MRNRFLILALVTLPFYSFNKAQQPDPKQLLIETINKYLNSLEYACDFKISVSCDKTETSGGNSQIEGKIVKKDSSLLLKQGKVQTLESGGYSLHISETDKVIAVQRASSDKKKSTLEQFLQFEKDKGIVTIIPSAKAGNTTLKLAPLESSDGYVKQAIIIIRPDGWIEKVTVEYDRSKQTDFGQKCDRIEVNYSNYVFQVPHTKNLDYSYYVLIAGNKVAASVQYKDYQVVSSLNIQPQ